MNHQCPFCKLNFKTFSDDGSSFFCDKCRNTFHKCKDNLLGNGTFKCEKCKIVEPASRCAFCGSDDISFCYDGGSTLCKRCGIYHHCKDGTIRRGEPGPLSCPVCSKGRPQPVFPPPVPFAGFTSGFAVPPAPVHSRLGSPTTQVTPPKSSPVECSHFCDGCNKDIQSNLAGKHFRCRECVDFDFCDFCVQNRAHNNLHHFYDYYLANKESYQTDYFSYNGTKLQRE